MVCEVNKIDSNISVVSIAEEVCPKQLPTLAVDGRDPEWFNQEVNTFGDFGTDYVRTARNPIDAGRQNKRGNISDSTTTAAWNADLTQRNSLMLAQGLFYADAYQPADTRPLDYAVSRIAITAVDGPANEFEAVSGLTRFAVGDIVRSSGFAQAANNVVTTITTSATGAIAVAADLATEGSPPATAQITKVGKQFASGDLVLTVAGGVAAITSTASAFPAGFVQPGAWIFVGGNTTGTQFTTAPNRPFFARVKSATTSVLTLDKTSFPVINDAGAAKTIQVFVGTHCRNEKSRANQVQRTFSAERTLGEDSVGPQSQYEDGCLVNSATISSPVPGNEAKVNIDWSLLALSEEIRDGAAGPRTGAHFAAPGESFFNTARDIIQVKLNILDPATLNPSNLFAYVESFTLAVSNNGTVNKAQGVTGGFSFSVGNFTVTGDINAFFTTVAAIAAIKNNAELTFHAIWAKDNGAIVFDIPTLGLGGGKPNVTKDAAIKLPVTTAAYESPFGHTASMTFFDYIPPVGMPA